MTHKYLRERVALTGHTLRPANRRIMTHEYLRKRVAEYFGFDVSKPFWIDERNEDGEFSPAPSLVDDIEFFDYAVAHSEILIYEAPRPTHWLDGKPCGTNATCVVYGTKDC